MNYVVDTRYAKTQTRTGVGIFLSILITLLVVIGVLGMLINLGITGMFLDKVPTGDRAMGLIVPIFVTGIAAIAMLLATWLCAGRGGLAWISNTPTVPALVATAVTLGIGVAAAGALLAWMEMQHEFGRAVPILGLLCSGLVPVTLGVVLLICGWSQPGTLAKVPAMKFAGAALALGAMTGYGLAAIGLREWIVQSSRNRQAANAERRELDDKWAKKRAMPTADRIREEFKEMSPEAPLWVFVAHLPEIEDDESRELIISRALQVPDFDNALETTMTDSCHLYRQGCAELIRHAGSSRRKVAWAVPLARSIRVTAEEMELRPAWLTEVSKLNPNPLAHLESLVAAAEAMGNPPEATTALNELHKAIGSLAAGDARKRAESVLDKWHNRQHAGS